MAEKIVIGNAELWHGDCREVLPLITCVDAVITDPPYSERCHSSHDFSAAHPSRDGIKRTELGYRALTINEVEFFAQQYAKVCSGWIVWMTDSDLAMAVRNAMEKAGRYAFSPLPFYQPGRSVRLAGDGTCSWTDWIVVSRTKKQNKWGTLPGGYLAGAGWKDKFCIGGKPTQLMRNLVSDYSMDGNLVLDTHMGAGTTGVDCVLEGRRFIGVEIDQAAFDIACERIDNAYRQRHLFPGNIAPEYIQDALF